MSSAAPIAATSTAGCSSCRGGLSIGVPAYYYPGPAWDETVAPGRGVRYLVVNPGDGPGPALDPAYVDGITRVRSSDVRLLGYVATTWGARPSADVLEDVRRFRDWYGVTGVFLDEASTARDQLPHYRDLTRAVRDGAEDALVALNPGVAPDEGYACIADLLLQFEGSWSTYERWSPPDWQSDHPCDRFWHVVYDTPARRMRQALERAAACRAGVVYVTDRRLDNPWDGLPSYWSAEVAAVAELQQQLGSPRSQDLGEAR